MVPANPDQQMAFLAIKTSPHLTSGKPKYFIILNKREGSKILFPITLLPRFSIVLLDHPPTLCLAGMELN